MTPGMWAESDYPRPEPVWAGHPLDPNAPDAPEEEPVCIICGDAGPDVAERLYPIYGDEREDGSGLMCSKCGAEPVEVKPC